MAAIHYLEKNPFDWDLYKSSYVFVSANGHSTVYYNCPYNGLDEVRINNLDTFKYQLKTLVGCYESKHLTEAEIDKLITSNGGHKRAERSWVYDNCLSGKDYYRMSDPLPHKRFVVDTSAVGRNIQDLRDRTPTIKKTHDYDLWLKGWPLELGQDKRGKIYLEPRDEDGKTFIAYDCLMYDGTIKSGVLKTFNKDGQILPIDIKILKLVICMLTKKSY